jgi:hypothetical protein
MPALDKRRKALGRTNTNFVMLFVLAVALVTATLSFQARSLEPLAGKQPRAVLVAEDDEVVLPSRVGTAIERATSAMDRAEAAIGDHDRDAAIAAFSAVVANAGRARRAAVAQMSAPPADPEAETTTGPDSVVAVLALDQAIITRSAGLLDTVVRPRLIAGADAAMRAADANRLPILDAVIGLDPETDGAAYADGMADTVDGYADETSNLSEALAADRLTPSARTALTNALARSKATAAKVTTAFGGGE